MVRYEYKVLPAPAKAQKAKGVKTSEGRFARTVEDVLNSMGAEGWEFQRAETLPNEERSGLTSTATSWRTMLVFRRVVGTVAVAAPSAAPSDAEPFSESPAETAQAPSGEPAAPAPRPAADDPSVKPLSPASWPDGTPMAGKAEPTLSGPGTAPDRKD
ncbi:DUF4177 domain-containing protein [Chachezhania sediminis]|uniref:DUF4177 domain-containing protein n=1 Tax=Chachezhania sediminis TaxID=2599291 RepID=UPI00131D6C06|nr:DUF4177 domain-containing protein [Chachezhania sediminis]